MGDNLETMPYAELQSLAAEKGLKSVGVSRNALIKSLSELDGEDVQADAVEADVEAGSEDIVDDEGIIDEEGPEEDEEDEESDDTEPAVADNEDELSNTLDDEVEDYAPEEIEQKKAPEIEVPKVTTTKNHNQPRPKPDVIPKVEFRKKLVKIKPRKDIPRSIIGTKVWKLSAGKTYQVPVDVARIFEEGGYL